MPDQRDRALWRDLALPHALDKLGDRPDDEIGVVALQVMS
jgi:hypothetical protein